MTLEYGITQQANLHISSGVLKGCESQRSCLVSLELESSYFSAKLKYKF